MARLEPLLERINDFLKRFDRTGTDTERVT